MKLYWGCLTSRRKGRAMQEPDKKEIVCYQRAINCSQSKRKWWSSSFIYLDIRLLNQRNVVLVVLKENCTFCFSYCPLDLKGFHLIAFIAHYCTLEKTKNSRGSQHQLIWSVNRKRITEQQFSDVLWLSLLSWSFL